MMCQLGLGSSKGEAVGRKAKEYSTVVARTAAVAARTSVSSSAVLGAVRWRADQTSSAASQFGPRFTRPCQEYTKRQSFARRTFGASQDSSHLLSKEFPAVVGHTHPTEAAKVLQTTISCRQWITVGSSSSSNYDLHVMQCHGLHFLNVKTSSRVAHAKQMITVLPDQTKFAVMVCNEKRRRKIGLSRRSICISSMPPAVARRQQRMLQHNQHKVCASCDCGCDAPCWVAASGQGLGAREGAEGGSD